MAGGVATMNACRGGHIAQKQFRYQVVRRTLHTSKNLVLDSREPSRAPSSRKNPSILFLKNASYAYISSPYCDRNRYCPGAVKGFGHEFDAHAKLLLGADEDLLPLQEVNNEVEGSVREGLAPLPRPQKSNRSPTIKLTGIVGGSPIHRA